MGGLNRNLTSVLAWEQGNSNTVCESLALYYIHDYAFMAIGRKSNQLTQQTGINVPEEEKSRSSNP